MPALTLMNVVAVLVFALVAGFAWAVGARIAARLFG
jgi:hypothetical protein